MRCEYLDQDYEQRMHGGVCFYNGQPVYLNATRGILSYVDFPLGNNPPVEIEKDDPLLDISSPRLGYVNLKNRCVFTYRKPERKYKQTLTAGAVGIFDPYGDGQRQDVGVMFGSEYFKNMLTDQYPTVKEAFKSLNGNVYSRAINRNVALVKDTFGTIRVFYKFDEVGHLKLGENTVHVPNGQLSWVVSKYLEGYGWEID